MNAKFPSLFRILGVAALLAGSQMAQAECGRVKIANMNWQSAEVLAEIDKIVLTEGYGCEVELVLGDTMPTLTSMMEKGQPDVAPEAWLNSVRKLVTDGVKDGRLHLAAESLKDGGIEGWWIPKYVADAHPEIKTMADALKRPDLFPSPDDPKKGAVIGCPSGWACQNVNTNAFKAWKAEAAGFVLVDPGSAAGLDGSIAKANERKQNWLGYYWSPTAILGKYEMVRLEADVPHDKEAWDNCNTRAECVSPKKNDWPKADVFTVVTDRFMKAGGEAYDYLSTRGWNNATVNELLAWMQDNQATGEDGAYHFLEKYPQIWTPWVSPEVAERVKAAL